MKIQNYQKYTNYIVKNRKIKYLQKIEEETIVLDTVLISASTVPNASLAHLKKVNTIFLMNSFELENELLTYGFNVESREEAILVLKDIEGIGIIYLDDKDIVRHRLVKKVIDAYKYTENQG